VIRTEKDSKEAKKILKCTIVGINKAESAAIINAFTYPQDTKSYILVGKHGNHNLGSTYVNKSLRTYLEAAGFQFVVNNVKTPRPKTEVAGLSVRIEPNGSSYVRGVIVNIVCCGDNKHELRDAVYNAEQKILDYMTKRNIPLARMCITQDTFCIAKYADVDTKFAGLKPYNIEDDK